MHCVKFFPTRSDCITRISAGPSGPTPGFCQQQIKKVLLIYKGLSNHLSMCVRALDHDLDLSATLKSTLGTSDSMQSQWLRRIREVSS